MSLNGQEPGATLILASKEWNDAQRKIVESFQKTQGTSEHGWLYPAVVLFIVSLLLVYSFFRRKRS